MIVRDYTTFADVEDYATYIGAADAADQLPRNHGLFSADTPTARLLRNLYDLSYDLETESAILYETSNHVDQMFVREWNDLVGWGVLEFVSGGIVRKLDFNYNDVSIDTCLDQGEIVKVIYTFGPNGDMITKRVEPKENKKILSWTTTNADV